MLVRLQTTKFLIYAELGTPQRVTDLASKNRSTCGRAMRFSMRLSNAGIIRSCGASRITGIPMLFGFRCRVDCIKQGSERRSRR